MTDYRNSGSTGAKVVSEHPGAVEVFTDEDDHGRLDAAASPGRATVPYYEADFGPRRFRW